MPGRLRKKIFEMRSDVLYYYPAGIPEGIFLSGDLRLGTVDAQIGKRA